MTVQCFFRAQAWQAPAGDQVCHAQTFLVFGHLVTDVAGFAYQGPAVYVTVVLSAKSSGLLLQCRGQLLASGSIVMHKHGSHHWYGFGWRLIGLGQQGLVYLVIASQGVDVFHGEARYGNPSCATCLSASGPKAATHNGGPFRW